MNGVVSRLKTALLLVLVLISLYLSYSLWEGIWQNTTETGFATPAVLTTSDWPRLQDSTLPFRIRFVNQLDGRATVALTSSPEYALWLTRLRTMKLSGLHMEPSQPMTSRLTVWFDFPISLDRVLLLNVVPGIQSSSFAVGARTIALYQGNANGPVSVVFNNSRMEYVAQTDISGAEFSHLVTRELNKTQWYLGSEANPSMVPVDSVSMPSVTCATEDASLIPLVHSFFINPLTLTHVAENKNLDLWTDGSRVVWWDHRVNSLQYQEPNTSLPQQTLSELTTVASFARNHGGTPDHVELIDEPGWSVDGLGQNLSFVPFIGGYPVLDPSMQYIVAIQNGHVVRYTRPITQLGAVMRSKMVRIMSYGRLTDVLENLVPRNSVKDMEIELGYTSHMGPHHTALMSPAYFVSQSGMLLWQIDAVSGRVLRGMGSP